MSGGSRRLLAAFAVILVAGLLRGQDAAVDSPISFGPQFLYGSLLGNSVWRPPAGGSQASPTGPVYRPALIPYPVGFSPITQMAGIVFSGKVTAVDRTSAAGGKPSTAITFKVETAIRGTAVGKILTIHEWVACGTGGNNTASGKASSCSFILRANWD